MFDFLLGNDLLAGIIAFVIVLIPAVLIHELGHFLAAKAVGITILEFGIGLPPRMLRLFTAGGTEYTLNWLPLGGFVRPLGEDVVRQLGEDELAKDRAEADARGVGRTVAVHEAKPLARIIFMAGGAVFNFISAILLFVIIALIGLPEAVAGRVFAADVAPGSALAAAGLQRDDLIEAINGEQFADADAFIDRLYALDGEQVTLSILRFEMESERPVPPSETLDLTFTLDLGETAPQPASYPIITGVQPDSPASAAGIEARDLVTAINGQPVTTFAEMRELTQANLGREVTISLLRGGEPLEVSLVPRLNPPQGQGAMGIQSTDTPVLIDSDLGLAYQAGPAQEALIAQSLPDAISYAFNQFWQIIVQIASVPGDIISGALTPEAARPVSVVGIGQMGAVFLQQSVQEERPTILLNFIAVISIALGLTNLLPLPALDGGRILFVLIELLRGRPIAPEREGMVHLVGLALLLSAMVVLMLNDIINPVTNLLR